MRRAKRSAFEIVLLRAKMQLFRLYLQLLLAVDAAVLAVGAQLKDLVALLFNAGDAAGILAAHETPACLRHSHTANKTGIATHRVTLSTATPKRPATESSVSKVLCIPAQPGKQRDTACLHAPQTAFPSSNKAFKKRGSPSHRNTTLSARKASFTGSSIAELHFCCTKIVIF